MIEVEYREPQPTTSYVCVIALEAPTTPLAPPGAGSLPCSSGPLLLGKALGAGPAAALTQRLRDFVFAVVARESRCSSPVTIRIVPKRTSGQF
jgi:hypothetical protein